MSSRLQPPALPALPLATERPPRGATDWSAGALARRIGAADLPASASIALILIALAGITAVAAVIALRTRVSVAAVGWLYLLIVLPVTLRWGRVLGLTTAAAAAFLLLTFLTEPRGLPYTTNGIDLISLLLSSGCIAIAVLLVHPAHAERSSQPRRLAEMARSAADARIEADPDGTIRRWSAGAERLFGLDAARVLGRSVGALTPDAQSEKLRTALGLLARGERVPALELVAARGDGSRIDISLALSPIGESGGSVAGVSLIARDITTRKRVERAFRSGDEMLESTIEKLPEGLLVFDEYGRMLLANGRAGALLHPVSAAPRVSFSDLFTQQYRLHPAVRWEDVARPATFNLLAVDRLDATRGWHLEVSRLEPQGIVHAVRYLLTLRDAAQELQEAGRQLEHGAPAQPGDRRAPAAPEPALSDAGEADSVSATAPSDARQGLTHRELQVLLLLASGRSNQEIAEELSITLNTAERHVANIYRKLHVRSRTHAAAYALQHGLIPLPEP